MRATTLALLALLLLPAAGHAAPIEEVVESGDVRAVLRYDADTTDTGVEYSSLHLTVSRAGTVVHDAPVVLADGEPCEGFCRPANAGSDGTRSVLLRDLDADRVPDAVVTLFTGGAHCCVVGLVVSPGRGPLWLDTASAGFRVGRDGLIVTADPRFEGAFSGYAASASPVQLLRLRAGRFTDVTVAEGRGRMRAEAARLWRAWRRIPRAQRRFAAGVLAAWAADRYRLGARRSALRTLRRELRGQRTVTAGQIDRRLRAWGYAR